MLFHHGAEADILQGNTKYAVWMNEMIQPLHSYRRHLMKGKMPWIHGDGTSLYSLGEL